MASALIRAVRTANGQQPTHRRVPEGASKTFKDGVPVMLSGGYLTEWDGTTVALGIAGVSKEGASNLSSAGVAKTLTYGEVVNQSSAVKIPMGAPLNDGRCAVDVADDNTIFFAQINPTGQTLAATDLGKSYGMTKDSDGHWYVDKTKSTVGTNTVCAIVAFDQYDTVRGVHIKFLAAAQQGAL